VRSATGRALREAPVVLVPLSLAAPGDRMGVDVPPIVVRAATGVAPARPEDARALVAFLASEPGQKAFAECRVDP
jgi:ABC-type molybdate transport system substrate-binding protein